MRILGGRFGERQTTLCSWVKAICRALEAAGCDSAALLAEAGFDAKSLDWPHRALPADHTARLWKNCRGGDRRSRHSGIKVASHIRQTTFHALSYGMSASSTLKEAFESVQRYCHVASDAIEYEFWRSGAEYHFVIEPPTTLPTNRSTRWSP